MSAPVATRPREQKVFLDLYGDVKKAFDRGEMLYCFLAGAPEKHFFVRDVRRHHGLLQVFIMGVWVCPAKVWYVPVAPPLTMGMVGVNIEGDE